MSLTQDFFYYLELLVSSGPRKEDYANNTALRELGEDAGGILTLPGMSFFWIADGTSQQSILYDFSSRIFAQDIGVSYQQAALKEYKINNDVSMENIIKNTFSYVEDEWKCRLQTRWGRLNEAEKEQLIMALVLCGDDSRRKTWSSTFLCGVIYHATMKLCYINAGDCGGLFTTSDNNVTLITPNSKRVFMAIDWYPGAQLPICTLIRAADIEHDISYQKGIKNFIFLTDGNTSGSLKNFLAILQQQPSFESISHILKRLRQNSYDDKTVLFGSAISY